MSKVKDNFLVCRNEKGKFFPNIVNMADILGKYAKFAEKFLKNTW